MAQQSGESSVSVGSITERAEKLELETPKPEEKAPEGAKPEEKAPETPAIPVPDAKKPETPVIPEKKEPNDPLELRRLMTKQSMELSDVKKQLQTLAETLSKTSRKQVDWKELAKDPVKLQAAVEEQRKADLEEQKAQFDKKSYESTAKYTRVENQRRMHDPSYPRWTELQPVIVKLAGEADKRVDFEKDPDAVLDQLYAIAQEDVAKDPNWKPAAPVAAQPANGPKSYSEAELQAKIADEVKKAVEKAQKGLAAEENGGAAATMGKGAPKGPGGVDKKALWNMPMHDLKAAIQQASEK